MLKRWIVSLNFFHTVLLFGTFCFFLALISRISNVDIDIYHEMALFRETLQLGRLPLNDLYSYLPTVSPVVHHEWGTGALLYLLTVTLGLGAPGLMSLKYLLTLFIVINCYRFAMQRGGETLTFIYTAFFGVVLGWMGFTTIRAQLFTLFLLLIFLFIIERDRKKDSWSLWLLPPLFVLWSNLHAGFVVGLGLLTLYMAENFLGQWLVEKNLARSLISLKKYFLVLAAICLGLFINPYGYTYFPYLLHGLTLDRTELILEWRPVWAISPVLLAIYCGAIIFTIHPLWYKKWKDLGGIFLVLAAAAAGLLHVRHLSLFALLFVCYVPGYLRSTPMGDGVRNIFLKNQRIMLILYIIITFVFGGYAVSKRFWSLKVPTDTLTHQIGIPVYPAGAVGYLEEHRFQGNLMTPFRMGAYVSWKLYPKVKVSMDSRFEVAYPYETVEENFNFYNGVSSWYQISQRYDTHGLLVPNWSPLKDHLDADSRTWKLVYTDGAYCLYLTEVIAKDYPLIDLGNKTIPGTFP